MAILSSYFTFFAFCVAGSLFAQPMHGLKPFVDRSRTYLGAEKSKRVVKAENTADSLEDNGGDEFFQIEQGGKYRAENVRLNNHFEKAKIL